MDLSPLVLHELVARLLEEDIGYGDITTLATVPPQARGHGRLWAKEALVLAGLDVALAVFHTLDSTIRLECARQDGAHLTPGSVIAEDPWSSPCPAHGSAGSPEPPPASLRCSDSDAAPVQERAAHQGTHY